jgi:deoxyadenosine/deoxycytidine kinase
MGLSQTRYSESSKLLHMQSQTEGFTSELEVFEAQKRAPKSFMLYEEYSRSNMAEIIKTRISDYNKTTTEKRKELEEEVEAEVNNFQKWLEETKNLNPSTAHYYAISLQGLLLGLPTGVQIAQLFSLVLDNL